MDVYTVLIVDDSRSMRLVIKKMIEQAGLFMSTVLEAENGLQALDIVEKNKLDIIFSDINMPVMSGLEFVYELKSRGNQVPIIMVTTEGSRDTVLEAIQNGAVGFIKKPFYPKMMKDILDKHLIK